MKKKAIVITGFMTLILLASNLLAASNLKAKASSSVTELKGGEEVTVTLRFDEYQQIKNGINAYKATLEYDKQIFEEVTEKDFVCQNDWEELKYNKDTGEFVAIKKVGSNTPEDVVKLTLKANESVKATTTDIKIKDIVTSEGERDIQIAETKVTINVIEEQTEQPDKPEQPEQEKITSQKYTITKDYIERILPNTTVKQFKENVTLENVTTDPQMVFTDSEGMPLEENSIITTGTKVKIGKTLQFTLVVIGDIDNDGDIGINDIAQLKLHIIEEQVLENVALKAADLDNDGDITIGDLAQMKLILIGLFELE